MRKTAIAACLFGCAGMAGAAAAAQTASPKASAPAASAPKARAAKAAKAPRPPALERLTCCTGPRDEQVRLIAQVVKGRTMEFAYYSRLGTGVCSIHGRRGDAYTRWTDTEGKSTVKLLGGTAELEYTPGTLRIKFDDVDRMAYCGMHGELNGSVEVTKSKGECQFNGVFDLGSAAVVETAKPEAPKPEAPKPEGPKPDGSKPEGPILEGPKPEGQKPESAALEAPDSKQPAKE